MTQNEAVYEALKELGGRSTNKLIYKHALPKADFSNAKTPKNTIRTILQRHPLIQWPLASLPDGGIFTATIKKRPATE